MNDVALAPQWDPNSGLPMPAYLADALGELGSNIADRMNVPSLSYEGKTWTIVKDGNKTKLQAKNSDGDMVPVPVMRVVLLGYNPDRGRAFYEGAYNPAASAAPKCWSADGKAPDPSVKEKQAALCANCPQSVKGSRVQDGEERIACSSHRMIAIAPAFDLSADPLRLKIAVTSDYDKDIVEHGWYAFRQYTDWLKSRGVSHTGLVVTKIKFDPNTAYPKLLFALDRLLTPEEIMTIKTTLENPKVKELLAEKWTAAGTAGTPVDDTDIKPWGLEGAYADGWAAHPDNPAYSFKGSDVITNEELAAKYPKPEPVIPAIPASEQVVDNAAVVPVAPAIPAAEPPAGMPLTSLELASNDGWAVHPDNPAYWFKGGDVVAVADVEAKYPPVAAAPTAPAAPAVPAAPVKTPEELATAEGWAVHPDNPAYWFKGSEVLPTAEVMGKFGATSGTAGAGAGSTSGGAADTSSTSTTATTGASPSSAEIPAEVQGLLDKWTGG